MLDVVVKIVFSPSAVHCFAPDEHLSSKQQDAGAAMIPSRKSDVKKHLSRRLRKHILPVRPVFQPDEACYGRGEFNCEIVSQIRFDSNWDRKLSSARPSITSTPNEVAGQVSADERRLA
jgi:hypothetical protein